MSIPALDHVVIDVKVRLDEAAAQYRTLGFHLTDRGYHTLGSANHLAIFRTNYLELLAMGLPGGNIRQELAPFPEGLNGLVLVTEDADADCLAVAARGVTMREPESFSRPVELAGGVQDARFRTTHVQTRQVPFGRFYFCQHYTRELVWRPEWQDHPNGAEDVLHMLIASDDPDATATLFTRMFGEAPEQMTDGALRFMAHSVALDIVTADAAAVALGEACPDPAGRACFIASLGLRTASLRQATAALAAVSPLRPDMHRLVVPARAAFNVALEFTE